MTKEIFEYHNGDRLVKADPLELMYVIPTAFGGVDPNLIQEQTKCGNPDGELEAMRSFLAGIRLAFKMIPYDDSTGKGARWDRCLDVWEDYVRFANEEKKNGEQEPTSCSAGDTLIFSPSPIVNSSACGLTPNAPIGDSPPA